MSEKCEKGYEAKFEVHGVKVKLKYARIKGIDDSMFEYETDEKMGIFYVNDVFIKSKEEFEQCVLKTANILEKKIEDNHEHVKSAFKDTVEAMKVQRKNNNEKDWKKFFEGRVRNEEKRVARKLRLEHKNKFKEEQK